MVGGRTRGEGRGVHHKTLVACAVEVRRRAPGTAQDARKDGRYAGRVRLAVAADRSAKSLCGFVEGAVAKGTLIVTDDWSGTQTCASAAAIIAPSLNAATLKSPRSSCPSAISSSPISRPGWRERITGSARGICRPISTSSRFNSTVASTRSTPSARCSALQAVRGRRPTTNFTQWTGRTLHLVGVCLNRIGMVHSFQRVQEGHGVGKGDVVGYSKSSRQSLGDLRDRIRAGTAAQNCSACGVGGHPMGSFPIDRQRHPLPDTIGESGP